MSKLNLILHFCPFSPFYGVNKTKQLYNIVNNNFWLFIRRFSNNCNILCGQQCWISSFLIGLWLQSKKMDNCTEALYFLLIYLQTHLHLQVVSYLFIGPCSIHCPIIVSNGMFNSSELYYIWRKITVNEVTVQIKGMLTISSLRAQPG